MSILSGALQPDAGEMTLDGASYAPPSPHEARRAGVAMIYQGLSLAPHLSVMENIALGVEPTRWGLVRRDDVRKRATEALARLGHPDIPPEMPVGRLSPAGQQLVEIARALGSGCRVLVLDEPTSSLGHDDVRRLFDLIARLKAQGLAIVYISHFIEEVKAISDRFVVLRDGRNAGTGPTAETDAGAIVSLMVGRAIDELYPRGPRAPGEGILEVESLVPGSATFTLAPGRDPRHRRAGRRRPHAPVAHALRAGACPFRPHPARRVLRAGGSRTHDGARAWGCVSEDRAGEGLAPGLSVAANLTASRLDGLGPGFVVLPSREDEAARRWIDALGIRCTSPRQPIASLSGGNQQKVAVARLLHHDVDVLVLDEPTRGIDVASKAQIYALLDQLVASHPARPARSKAVLLVSSYLPELVGVCDRIAVMSRGRLDAPRPAAEWTEHALLMAASGAQSPS